MTSLDGATQHLFLAAYKAQLPWICTLENVLKKSSFWALVILSVRSKASVPSIGWKFGKCHHGQLELWRLTSKGFSLQVFQKRCQWKPVPQAICLIQICKKKNLISTCMQEAGEGEYNRPENSFLNPCDQIAVGSAGHHRKLWKILGKRGALTTRGGKTWYAYLELQSTRLWMSTVETCHARCPAAPATPT